jgi:cardiolipin synthase A/B
MAYVTIKNIAFTPATVDNSGGGARLECEVFTEADAARIKDVVVENDALGMEKDRPLKPVRGHTLKRTGEGFFFTTVSVPPLTEPGDYPFKLRARDSEGYTGRTGATLKVTYARTTYGGPLAAESRAAFEKFGASPIMPGNRVELLWNGAHSLERRLELIAGARRQVNLQNYVFDLTGNGKRIYDTLAPRLEHGVEANILLNASTQLPSSLAGTLRLSAHRLLAEAAAFLEKQGLKLEEHSEAADFVQRLERRKAVNLVLFTGSLMEARGMTPGHTGEPAVWLVKMIKDALGESFFEDYPIESNWQQAAYTGPGGLPALPLLDYAIHEKILIADGRRAIVGGRNLSDEYFAPWIDLDALIEGPVVREIQRGFIRSFREFSEPTDPPPTVVRPRLTAVGDVDVQFVQSRPWLGELNTMKTVVTAFQTAKKSIYAYSQYLVLPDSQLLDALVNAAERGVDVRVLTNSHLAGQDLYWSTGFFISLNYFPRLMRAGVRLFLHPGFEEPKAKQPYLHAKEFIIDGELAMIGSFNLSMRSCFVESENLVNIFDPAIAEAEQARFLTRLEAAAEVTPKFMQEAYREHRSTTEFARSFELFF